MQSPWGAHFFLLLAKIDGKQLLMQFHSTYVMNRQIRNLVIFCYTLIIRVKSNQISNKIFWPHFFCLGSLNGPFWTLPTKYFDFKGPITPKILMNLERGKNSIFIAQTLSQIFHDKIWVEYGCFIHH